MTLSNRSLAVGSWTLWGFALVIVACRFASRRVRLGSIRRYQLDEYLMLIAVISLTGVVVSSNQVAINGSNYVPDEVVEQWSASQIKKAVWGSKMLLALEEFMLATLWLVKACFLILYARMTSGLREGLAVKIAGAYCVIGFVVIQILYLGVWCRPIQYYWAVPVPHSQPQCKSYHNHMITTTVLHVSSDLLLMSIPIPMIVRARLPLKRKLVLCAVFSLGVSVVIVAILNRYYNFTQPNELVFLIWYNGEASTAVMIANIPMCWALLQKIFSLDAWGSNRWARSASASGPPIMGHPDYNRYARRNNQSSMASLEPHQSSVKINGRKPGRGDWHELDSLERDEESIPPCKSGGIETKSP